MPTYTTSWEAVSDGQSNVYNTDTLTGEDTTNIHNAEVQWEGVSTTSEETTTYSNSNAVTYTSGGDSISVSYPSNGNPVRARGTVETSSGSNSYDNADADLDNGEDINSYTFDINPPTDYGFTNSIVFGTPSSASVTLYAGNNTYDIIVTAESEETSTVTKKTETPSVGGDVSASGPTSLNDGDTSSWYALSGLSAGVDETFNFSINGSNEARFRFRFDYDPPTASPTYGTYSVQYGGTWYEIAIADPTDSQLQTDEVQIYSNGSWGVLDLVPASYSDPYTVDFIRFYNGTEWLKARVYNTRSV